MPKLYQALAKFQSEMSPISKDSDGYNYKYASYSAILEAIKEPMNKNGLGFTQVMEGDKLKTILFHIEEDFTIESIIDIPQGAVLKGQNEFQTLGSALTYLRRYSLSAILGLDTDGDTDAAGEQEKKSKPKEKKDVDVWLSPEQYKEVQTLESSYIQKCLDKYNGKPWEDGKVYQMKADYRKNLKSLL